MTNITPSPHNAFVVAEFNALGATAIERLKRLMQRLRDPDNGCPWDQEQTYASIAPYTIEEAYEVNEAIQNNDMVSLKEELGDLLLQVIFHAQISDEAKAFDFDSICDDLVKKMIHRHPHVFIPPQSSAVTNKEDINPNWESIKEQSRKDKGYDSLLDDVPLALPALMRAEKLQKRAARVGFDWDDIGPVIEKIQEETQEVLEAVEQKEPQGRIHEEVGDLLFAVTNLARKLGVAPEHALRDGNDKFTRRFQFIEQNSDKPLADQTIDKLENMWVKAKEKGL